MNYRSDPKNNSLHSDQYRQSLYNKNVDLPCIAFNEEEARQPGQNTSHRNPNPRGQRRGITGCTAVVAGNTTLKLSFMASKDSYVVLELRELNMMITKRALAKGMVLNDNLVVDFEIRKLENEGSEFEARSFYEGHVVR